MSSNITIVAYHYVRDEENSKYPGIRALPLHLFEEQIDRFESSYEFVTLEQCLAALDGRSELPENAVMLTFDDGYADHFHNVFPILKKKRIQGLFFPSVLPIKERKVLEVNKIQFIIAAVDLNLTIKHIFDFLDQNRKKYGFESNQYYVSRFCREKWYDSKEVILVKSLLQKELRYDIRSLLIDELFEKFVAVDEKAFSDELYASIEQLRIMSRSGMIIGGHGYSHDWMDSTMSPEQRQREIDLTLDFVRMISGDARNWVFCYPHGAYNESLVSKLKENKCRMAFTIDPGMASLTEKDALALKRFDTNEFLD